MHDTFFMRTFPPFVFSLVWSLRKKDHHISSFTATIDTNIDLTTSNIQHPSHRPASLIMPASADLLKTTVVYLPALLAVAELQLALTFNDKIDLPSDTYPWTDPPTGAEVVLEKRGLMSDAFVGLLGHMVVYLSGEAPVRLAAKLMCTAHMALLTYFGPFLVAAYARTAEGSTRFNAAVSDKNFWSFAGFTVVNLVGTGILYTDNRKMKNA